MARPRPWNAPKAGGFAPPAAQCPGWATGMAPVRIGARDLASWRSPAGNAGQRPSPADGTAPRVPQPEAAKCRQPVCRCRSYSLRVSLSEGISLKGASAHLAPKVTSARWARDARVLHEASKRSGGGHTRFRPQSGKLPVAQTRQQRRGCFETSQTLSSFLCRGMCRLVWRSDQPECRVYSPSTARTP
jgi:hypothetical protein